MNFSEKKTVIFGNSASGKSTLARAKVEIECVAHLDLDTVAWQPGLPPVRKPFEQSTALIRDFISSHQGWVIEGCYGDLLEFSAHYCTEMIYMDLPLSHCLDNAKCRPWESHKYPSKQAQDDNLEMLLGWISEYEVRTDTFSKLAHQNLFNGFDGKKTRITSNQYS